MRSKIRIQHDIAQQWAGIVSRAGVLSLALECLPMPENIEIMGTSTKTDKGRKRGTRTAVVYLSPDDRAFPPDSGRTMCAWAGQCSILCLGHNSGRLAWEAAQRSELWKTALFLGARGLFLELISHEIRALAARCKREKSRPAVRFDGSSDTGYGETLAKLFPRVTFYDYTKGIGRLKRARKVKNWHVTYSYSEKSPVKLPEGSNVAVVFDIGKSDPLPKRWGGRRVISGDKSDERFRDPRNVIVGLYFKAARDRDGHRAAGQDFLQSVDS